MAANGLGEVDPDFAAQLMQESTDAKVDDIRRAAAAIPPGEPGDCDLCGEWFGRLVGGACARCRDKHGLP